MFLFQNHKFSCYAPHLFPPLFTLLWLFISSRGLLTLLGSDPPTWQHNERSPRCMFPPLTPQLSCPAPQFIHAPVCRSLRALSLCSSVSVRLRPVERESTIVISSGSKKFSLSIPWHIMYRAEGLSHDALRWELDCLWVCDSACGQSLSNDSKKNIFFSFSFSVSNLFSMMDYTSYLKGHCGG